MSLIPRRNRHPAGPYTFGELMDDFFRTGTPWGSSLLSDTFRVDLKEEENRYLIEAEMPGVNKDEIDIQLENGYLTIAVTRNEDTKADEENYIHRERRSSSMARTAYLPHAAEDGTQAKLKNGILKLEIPKAKEEKKRSHSIEIH